MTPLQKQLPLTAASIYNYPALIHQLLSIKGALKLEKKTGLRHSRGSVLRQAKRLYGIKSFRKEGAIKELETLQQEVENLIRDTNLEPIQ